MPSRGIILRYLSVLAVLAIAIPGYIYYTLRPPYALYDGLFQSELKDSQDLIRNTGQRKYVKFKQLQGAGFNNQAQEILLFHHLALQTGRTYVYQPFIWRPRGEKATVPLSAFLRGPTRGSISEATFNEVCPESDVKHVRLVTNHNTQWSHAKEVLSKDDRCIVVDDWLFSWKYLGSTGIHDIWPSYQKYLNTHFEWSPQVLSVVDKTEGALNLKSNRTTKHDGSYMALHLRRGDFEGHCAWLKSRQTGFTTWTTLPLLSSSILPPALSLSSPDSIYTHCYPSLPRILSAITRLASQKPHLRRIHILHDGAFDHPLVYLQYHKLKAALMNPEWARRNGWKGGPMVQVTQSSDLKVERGERDWKVCVDMELAVRADAFVGNGYSSLSSTIVALRLARDGAKAEDIVFV
ncbi:hypothetical protein MD484_g8000, partial [Candolleomyces efflorescens]